MTKDFVNNEREKQYAGHGSVKAAGTHFEYEDGTLYYPFGTTVYALFYQPEKRIDMTMATLRESGFNKIRVCLFPKHYDYNGEEPEVFPFEKGEDGAWDMKCPVPRFWDHVERRIRELDEMGIQCDLILFHPYDRWGFSTLPKEDALAYLEYVVKRLGDLPNIWWSLANEYDLMDYTEEDWKQFAAFIREKDECRHLLSNHNMAHLWDFADPNTTHISIQTKNVDEVSKLIRRYEKPLVVDECCYEGNIPKEWGNISGFEMAERFWKVFVQGGYASHGETFLDEDDVLWWSKGGLLKGESASRIAFLRRIAESMPGPVAFDGMDLTMEEVEQFMQLPQEYLPEPFGKLVKKCTPREVYDMILANREFTGHCGEDVFVKYMSRHCAAVTEMNLPEKGVYDIDCIDIWKMTTERVKEGVSGKVELTLPGKEGIAVLARKRVEKEAEDDV